MYRKLHRRVDQEGEFWLGHGSRGRKTTDVDFKISVCVIRHIKALSLIILKSLALNAKLAQLFQTPQNKGRC